MRFLKRKLNPVNNVPSVSNSRVSKCVFSTLSFLINYVHVGLDDGNGGDVNQNSSQNVMMLHLWNPLSFYPLCCHYKAPFCTSETITGHVKGPSGIFDFALFSVQ